VVVVLAAAASAVVVAGAGNAATEGIRRLPQFSTLRLY
jgi:hypothetical protein